MVNGKTTNETTLKDVNFLVTKKKIKKLTSLDSPTARKLVASVRSDVAFLQSFNLMDYSLLIAIERSDVKKINLHQDPSFLSKFAHHAGFLALTNKMFQSKVHKTDDRKDIGEWMSQKHRFVHDKKILHISIIDYLQEWNLNKKGERFIKTIIQGKNPDRLSAIEPERYAQRFRNFVQDFVFNEP